MRHDTNATRHALALTGSLVVVLGLSLSAVSCAAPTADETSEISPYAGVSPDPNDVPVDDTDYSQDAGNHMPEFEYDDEPEPDEAVVATLCNLNQGFLLGLRNEESGRPVVDDVLRTNLVGLGDLIAEWQNLRAHVPDAVPDIEVAEAVHEKWDEALILTENGDLREAQLAMNEAERLLQQLPKQSPKYCTP